MPQIEGAPEGWALLVDTNDDEARENVVARGTTRLEARSLKLFRRPAHGERLATS